MPVGLPSVVGTAESNPDRESVQLFCLTLQLSFCFKVRALSDRLVSSTPE
jgi:hypothetical protein